MTAPAAEAAGAALGGRPGGATALCAAGELNFMDDNYTHLPVLAEEAVRLLVTDKSGVYVDATLGLGGHAVKLLSTLDETGRVLGIDWDPEMAALAAANLKPYGGRAKIVQGNFADIDRLISGEHLNAVSGVLFDLGISSLHFEKPSRGFSLKHDGPLDMRINPANPLTAYSIVNHWPYEQIEHLIRICGEHRAGRIAREIVDKRRTGPVETTAQLRILVENAAGRSGGKTHPATRTFLALRVAVNYEFDNLTRGMQKVMPFLSKGGRMGVITFHSLEDRIVKETFRFMAKMGGWNLVTRKPVVPSEAEIESNKRARSAKLRVIEKA